ncbi:hypothetical protein BRADI_5g20394v3 [Brachypodium distachyon]|uniref:Uncharacterized protein n=1 Tax=Brachypodium distachyon TaxID=15368 RepID=A0A2K2CIB2_BRADI|nr:hypothetical protein BRADI_5g20394v3 [Brachypodium distachyon]
MVSPSPANPFSATGTPRARRAHSRSSRTVAARASTQAAVSRASSMVWPCARVGAIEAKQATGAPATPADLNCKMWSQHVTGAWPPREWWCLRGVRRIARSEQNSFLWHGSMEAHLCEVRLLIAKLFPFFLPCRVGLSWIFIVGCALPAA